MSIHLCEQEKVKSVFDNLIQLEHLNIVKFHKYWADINDINRARVSSVCYERRNLPCLAWLI